MKKVAPNCSAPQGLPQGRTPSWMSLVHSKACMPTKVAPSAAVDQHQPRRRHPVAAVAVVDRQRHGAGRGDQHEGHDRDQDQRDVLAEEVQREDLARVRPWHRRRRARGHVGDQEAAEDEGVAEQEDPHHRLLPGHLLEGALVGGPVGDDAAPAGEPGPAGGATEEVSAMLGIPQVRRPRQMLTKSVAQPVQQHQQAEPDEQQEVPVGDAELEAEPERLPRRRRPRRRARRAPAPRGRRGCAGRAGRSAGRRSCWPGCRSGGSRWR